MKAVRTPGTAPHAQMRFHRAPGVRTLRD